MSSAELPREQAQREIVCQFAQLPPSAVPRYGPCPENRAQLRAVCQAVQLRTPNAASASFVGAVCRPKRN